MKTENMTTLERHFMQLAKEITVRPVLKGDSVDHLIHLLETKDDRGVLRYTKRYSDSNLYGKALTFLDQLDVALPELCWGTAVTLLKAAQTALNRIPSLKVWSEYFKSIRQGLKTFEVRQGEFTCGQLLFLKEWNWVKWEYTGSAFLVEITYVLPLTDGGLGDRSVLPFPVDSAQPVCVFGFVKL